MEVTTLKLPFKPWDKVLELGGGANPLRATREWINLDTRWLPGVDVVANLHWPVPLPNESVDGVYGRYYLEHLSWRKVPQHLTDVFRVLKPGGTYITITANLLEQCQVAVRWFEDGKGLEVGEMVFGSQEFGVEWDAGAHHSGFSPHTLTELLKAAGFYSVEVQPIETEHGPTDMMGIARKSRAEVWFGAP